MRCSKKASVRARGGGRKRGPGCRIVQELAKATKVPTSHKYSSQTE